MSVNEWTTGMDPDQWVGRRREFKNMVIKDGYVVDYGEEITTPRPKTQLDRIEAKLDRLLELLEPTAPPSAERP